MDMWAGWPADWRPREQRVLEGRQRCRRCGRELRGTAGRPVPGVGWMHAECAVALVAERTTSATASVYLLDESEVEEPD
jgi:hypothetical protein